MLTVRHATRAFAIVAFAGASAISSVQAADFSAVPSGSYSPDPTHTYVTLTYSHLGLSNPQLQFDDADIDLKLDRDDPMKSSVNVTVQVESLLAGSDIFYGHLTGPDFFDLANFPTITFVSNSVEEERDGKYKVLGDLTVKGVTRPMEFTVSINNAIMHPMMGTPVIGIDVTGSLIRSEYGLGKYAPHVGDEVSLHITSELVAD